MTTPNQEQPKVERKYRTPVGLPEIAAYNTNSRFLDFHTALRGEAANQSGEVKPAVIVAVGWHNPEQKHNLIKRVPFRLAADDTLLLANMVLLRQIGGKSQHDDAASEVEMFFNAYPKDNGLLGCEALVVRAQWEQNKRGIHHMVYHVTAHDGPGKYDEEGQVRPIMVERNGKFTWLGENCDIFVPESELMRVLIEVRDFILHDRLTHPPR